MYRIGYPLITWLLRRGSPFLLAFLLLSACTLTSPSTPRATNAPTLARTPPPLSSEASPTPPSTPTPSLPPSPTAEPYQRLSPSQVRVPGLNLNLELSGRLTQATLNLDLHIVAPQALLTLFPQNVEPSFIQEMRLAQLSMPLVLEPFGGGGGGGAEAGMVRNTISQLYRVKSPLFPGQRVQLTVLVTLHERLPLRATIPLTVELTVEPAPLTPEG